MEIKLGADGKIRLNDSEKGNIEDTEMLGSLLKEMLQQRTANPASDRSITIRAVKSGRYGDVVRLIDAVKGAGAGPIIIAIDDLFDDDAKDFKDPKKKK